MDKFERIPIPENSIKVSSAIFEEIIKKIKTDPFGDHSIIIVGSTYNWDCFRHNFAFKFQLMNLDEILNRL